MSISESWIGLARKERPRFVPPRAEKRDLLPSERLNAWPQGVLSLDVTFDDKGTPYILEIHGAGAGFGLERVNDAEFERPIDKRVRQIARIWNQHSSKYNNPSWFQSFDMDKATTAREGVISKGNEPETISEGRFDRLFEKGWVIVKPRAQSEGFGIRIFNSTQIAEAHAYAEELRERNGAFVAQELIESRGAAQASGALKGHAASMRLLVPYQAH